jgi:hypothetical protein
MQDSDCERLQKLKSDQTNKKNQRLLSVACLGKIKSVRMHGQHLEQNTGK